MDTNPYFEGGKVQKLVGFLIWSLGSQEANNVRIHITATFYVAHSATFVPLATLPVAMRRRKNE
jgi:hypothetical protein